MVKITDTTLRDAHQSLIATRLRTEDMLPILEKMDEVGFYSLECWGGATFDAAMRYLCEDPWDRLRKIRERVQKTPLQMLLRGQNLLGYRHYSDDIVKRFIPLCVKNGIDIIRIFDALNDIRNMELAIKVAKDVGAIVQGAICYTISPVHTIESFVELAVKLEELGCDVICIKDMSGIISPQAAYDLVLALKRSLRVPVHLHTHSTSGMGMVSYYAACQAGVDIIDCAFSPFAGGTSQPPLEPMVACLKGTPYDPGFDLEKLIEIGYYWLKVREKYQALITPVAERPDVSVLIHQIPGGMITNLYSQLKEQRAVDRYREVLEEVPRVREDLGYPPLVTPTSQIVGTQAVLNVLMGERYKKVTEEVKRYCLGYYGRPPAPIKEEVLKKVIGDEKPIDVRPADLLEPEWEKIVQEVQELGLAVDSEEDILTYAMYPQIAAKFFRCELVPEEIPASTSGEKVGTVAVNNVPDEFVVTVDGEEFHVKVRPVLSVTRVEEEKRETPVRPREIPRGAITSPMQGMIVALKKKVGDRVQKGETVAVLEAMKMQTEIHSDFEGVVKEIYVYETEIVDFGDVIMVVE
ncbi:sodium-extruding oxaloacetate decarboxylase subunit alpha [Candidatus Caldatribacterium saccharofermentans]|uniref:Oxaloacetate decarboxylase subunit alpha n=1 Tax=Candidatus Caldatribacterium saccharofermentans TaxID=1454753 RepID=A0A7V4WL82_9BACT